MGQIKGNFPVTVKNLKQLAKRMKRIGAAKRPETHSEWLEFISKGFGYSNWHEAETVLGKQQDDELVSTGNMKSPAAFLQLSKDYGDKTVFLTEEGFLNNTLIVGKVGSGRLEVLRSIFVQGAFEKNLPLFSINAFGDNVDFADMYGRGEELGKAHTIRVLNFTNGQGMHSHYICPLRDWSQERILEWLTKVFFPLGEIVPDEAAILSNAIRLLLTKRDAGERLSFMDLAQSLEWMANDDATPKLKKIIKDLYSISPKVEGIFTEGGEFGEISIDEVFSGYGENKEPLRLMCLIPAPGMVPEDNKLIVRMCMSLIPDDTSRLSDSGIVCLSGCGLAVDSDFKHMIEHLNAAGWGVAMEAVDISSCMPKQQQRKKFLSCFNTKIIMQQDDPEAFDLMPGNFTGKEFLPRMEVGEGFIVFGEQGTEPKHIGKLQLHYKSWKRPNEIRIART